MKCCIIIPVYRHVEALSGGIDRFLSFGLNLILIDDGNSAADAKRLQEISRNSLIVLTAHKTNLGKGAALITGLEKAKSLGFTHALQIDADGQHCIDDIPKFIETAKARPEDLILGKPIFDSSAPLGRILGRKLTLWLIWLETLSFQVGDGLFGFRVYPINSTLRIIENKKVNLRMGFDTEIIVRLVRSGLKVVNIPTPVRYPEQGFSNFKYLQDNICLVLMHIRLLVSYK